MKNKKKQAARKRAQIRRQKQKEEQRLKQRTSRESSTSKINGSLNKNAVMSTKLIAAITTLVAFAQTAAASDSPHPGWMIQAFQTLKDQIQFTIEFDPKVFANLTAINNQITAKCGSLVEQVSTDWWNDGTFASEQEFPGGIYKTRAEAFKSVWEAGRDLAENISITDSIWDCLHQTIDPECDTRFFLGWNTFLQIGVVVGIPVGLCLLANCLSKCGQSNNTNEPDLEKGEGEKEAAPSPNSPLLGAK